MIYVLVFHKESVLDLFYSYCLLPLGDYQSTAVQIIPTYKSLWNKIILIYIYIYTILYYTRLDYTFLTY